MNQTTDGRQLASQKPRPEVLDEYDIHPVAAMWPLIGEADAQELARDILEHGQKEPIWMFQGQLIDGRNRLVACDMAGVEPRFEEWRPAAAGETPVTFIMSKNLHRRHLTGSVRATIAVQVEEWLIAERKRIEDERNKVAANFPSAEQPPASPQTPKGSTEAVFGLGAPATSTVGSGKSVRVRDQAAKIVGVASGYVGDAKDIRKTSPETFERVASGELTIPAAQEALVDEARRDGVLADLGLRPGAKTAALRRLEEREHRAERQAEPARPRVKIRKFSRVESSRVEVSITATFGNPAKAEEWLERMAAEKSVLGLSFEVDGGDGPETLK